MSFFRTLQRMLARCCGRHGGEFKALRIVLRQVLVDQLDDVGVMSAILVQPEHCWPAASTSTRRSKLHPVLDGNILRLARSPNVALLNIMLEDDVSVGTH